MDKLQKLKCLLVASYFSYLRKLEKGYPQKDYECLKTAMLTVNFIQNNTLPAWQRDTIIDKLNINISTQ